LEEEKKLKKKIIKGNWGNIKTKARQSTVQTKVHSYTEAFEKIKAAAGIGASRSARLGFVFLGGGSRPVSSPPTSRRFKRVHVGIVGRIARSLARSLSLAHPRHRATTPPVRVLSLSQTTSTRS
jgi:hypothetical protein